MYEINILKPLNMSVIKPFGPEIFLSKYYCIFQNVMFQCITAIHPTLKEYFLIDFLLFLVFFICPLDIFSAQLVV